MSLISMANKVDARNLRSYLSARQWVEHNSRLDYLAIYRTSDDSSEVVVPLDKSFSDYHRAIISAARRIAEAEERDVEHVLSDLLQARTDIIRFALTGAGTESGSVDVVSGVSLAAGSLHALRASASSAERPQKFHPRMTLADTEALIKACRFGQTEVGSFVLTVEVPLEVDQIDLLASGETPFGRKTTAHLLGATHQLVTALSNGDIRKIVDGENSIVSANLCDALIEMAPRDESLDIRIGGAWSPSFPAPPLRPTVVVDRSMFEKIAEVGDRLRPTLVPTQSMFFGRVTDLHGEPGPNGIEGDVTIKAQVGASLLNVKFPLNHDDYREAVEAHIKEQHVCVRGTLRRRPRSYYLTDVAGFKRLQDV
jgi:hypothetical protein